MKKIIPALFIFINLFQFGCASITSGRYQDVAIYSTPPGASVEIDDSITGKTPLNTDLKRKSRHKIRIFKEGYKEEVRTTSRGFNWWFLGNILSPVGMLIDFITGAVYEVQPDDIQVKLQEVK